MKRLLTATLALSLVSGAAAMAQPDHRDDRDNRNGQYQGHNDNRGNAYGHDDQSRGNAYGHDDRNGGHEGRHWSRGQRLPSDYYADRSHYVDYRAHHLRRPPRGYQWVQADDNYALVALASGVIASIVASQH